MDVGTMEKDQAVGMSMGSLSDVLNSQRLERPKQKSQVALRVSLVLPHKPESHEHPGGPAAMGVAKTSEGRRQKRGEQSPYHCMAFQHLKAGHRKKTVK